MAYLKEKPLLLRACEQGKIGSIFAYENGEIADALFLFLLGKPNEKYFIENKLNLKDRHIVCLSFEWEEYLKSRFPKINSYTRFHMFPKDKFDLTKRNLPEGYLAKIFDEKAFDLHPFNHGEHYENYADFEKNGAGGVILFENQIVASASSFLTLGNEVELDISTLENHQKKGLGEKCTEIMLEECMKKGLLVHWDAMNTPSKNLALKFGYEVEQEYTVYLI